MPHAIVAFITYGMAIKFTMEIRQMPKELVQDLPLEILWYVVLTPFEKGQKNL